MRILREERDAARRALLDVEMALEFQRDIYAREANHAVAWIHHVLDEAKKIVTKRIELVPGARE